MSLFASLHLGRLALQASRFSLDVAGNNIANVNTPGFSRRRVDLAETPPLFTGRDLVGTGVGTSSIFRVVDRLLGAQIRNEAGAFGRDRSIAGGLSQIESFIGETGGQGISSALSEFFTAFSELSGDPLNNGLRTVVALKADTLAGTVRRAVADIETVRQAVDGTLTAKLDRVGALAREIAGLNRKIQVSEPGAGEASALRDARDVRLRELSELVDITVAEGSRGSVNVALAGTGDTIVDEANAIEPVGVKDASGFTRIQVSRGGVAVDVTDRIRGGEIGGLLHVRDTAATDYLARLDTFATELIDGINGQHTAGFDANGGPGINFFVDTAPGASSAATLALSASILADPNLIAASGDAASTGDGANALAIAQTEGIPSPGLGGQNLAGFLATLQSRLGLDAEGSRTAELVSRDALATAENRQLSISGVDLDEEATQLLRFQRSYEAAARFISVINDMTRVALELGT